MAKQEDPIPIEPDEAPLSLEVDDTAGSAAPAGTSKIQAFGAASTAGKRGTQQFKRPLNLSGFGATRCRVFNSKVTVASLDHMVNTINEWLDTNQIEIKYVNQVIGIVEGKVPEPNMIVTVWY
jgi:hypothetical protein